MDCAERFFTNALALIEVHEDKLGRLDAAAGDGDHGRGMVRGLRAAVEALASTSGDGDSVGARLVQGGSAFADAAGGASGALFGALCMAIGGKLRGVESRAALDVATVHAALQAGLDTVAKLGKAAPGDKTFIDALAPFIDALGEELRVASLTEAWQNALPAAQAGTESTADMIAKRGRASKLGERSRGHIDAGAMSMLYLLRAAGKALEENGKR